MNMDLINCDIVCPLPGEACVTREEAEPRLSDPFLCFILISIEQFTISIAFKFSHIFRIQLCATY